ncbi:MAG: hypothetical protein HY815_12660 [Candidatus Riflebacteria bacterium]|nr:hypothetical protein [Candidatus Riflebacteria bacterium]
MARALRPLAALLLGALVVGASAGEVSTPASPVVARRDTASALPILDPAVRIVMRTAAVIVDLAPVTIPGETPAQRLPAVEATVDCEFVMLAVESRSPRTTFAMAFPVGYDEDVLSEYTGAARLTAFTVSAGGESPALHPRRWEGAGPGGERVHYHGYAWTTTAVRHTPLRITVRYSLLLPVWDDASAFTYILCSAAGWHGPLGRETVLVKARPGLTVRPVQSRGARAVGPGDRSYAWDLRNVVPDRNVHVRILLAGPPRRSPAPGSR